jgi:hypothetical protein
VVIVLYRKTGVVGDRRTTRASCLQTVSSHCNSMLGRVKSFANDLKAVVYSAAGRVPGFSMEVARLAFTGRAGETILLL